MAHNLGTITQNGNEWNKWDELFGVRLTAGTKLAIKWPNGWSVEPVLIGKSSQLVSPTDPETHTAKFKTVEYAYVKKCYRGVKIWVHLKDLKAKFAK